MGKPSVTNQNLDMVTKLGIENSDRISRERMAEQQMAAEQQKVLAAQAQKQAEQQNVQQTLEGLLGKYKDRSVDVDANGGIRVGAKPQPNIGALLGLSPAQKALDVQEGKAYGDYTTSGRANAEKGLQQLAEAKETLLKPGNSILGMSTISGKVVGNLPDFLRPSQSIAAQQKAQENAVQTIKSILGSQFTEKDREFMTAMAYDPKLPPEENAKKIDGTIKYLREVKAARDSKAGYFEQKGTFKGYQDQGLRQPPQAQVGAGAQKKPMKKEFSASRNQTRITYEDGSQELVNGRQ